MKTFKQFNENIRNLLTGKSEEDIKKELDKLDTLTGETILKMKYS